MALGLTPSTAGARGSRLLLALIAVLTFGAAVDAALPDRAIAAAAPSHHATATAAPTVGQDGLFGMNDGGVDFVDVMMGPQGDRPQPASGSGTLTEDANGWPTEDVTYILFDQRQNMPWDGPDPTAMNPDISGTYHLSFQGQATISGYGLQAQGQQYDSTTNTTTAAIVITPEQWFVELTFKNTRRTAASPVDSGLTGIRLIRPGYPLNTQQIFTNETINAYRATTGPIRTIDLSANNSYQNFTGTSLINVTWADRVKVTDAYQGGTPTEDSFAAAGHQGHGVAWEYIVMLANKAGRGLWINIPAGATDGYTTNLADLLRYGSNGLTPYTSPQAHPVYAGLNPGLPVYVEYSDEVWNFSFPQYVWNVKAAQEQVAAGGSPLNSDGTTNAQILGARRYAQRVYQISSLFRAVYGSAAMDTTVRPVLLWQYQASYYEPGWLGWGSGTADVLDWFSRTYGAPNKYFYGIGTAMYYGPSDKSSVNNIIDTMWTGGDQTRAQAINWRALATYYGLNEVGYESGPSLAAGLGGEATNSPAMQASELHEYLENWYAAGGDTIEFFALRGNISPYGDWLAVTNFQDLNTPKMKGVESVENSAAPAVNAGYLLPTVAGSPVTIDPSQYAAPDGVAPDAAQSIPGTGYTAGPYDYLLRVAYPGTYSFSLAGSQDTTGLREQVSIDDNPVATISLPAAAGTVPIGQVKLGAGLHTLRIQYGYLSGVTAGDAHPTGIRVGLTTGGGAVVAPSVPGSPTVKSVSTGAVNLAWPAGTLATTYTVERSQTSGGPYIAVARVATNTYSDRGLADGTTYYYAVTANDAAGSSEPSPQVAATPTNPSAPLVPGGLAATFAHNGVVSLQWDSNPQSTDFRLYRSANGGSYTLVTTQLADSYLDTGLTDGTVYSYKLVAANSFGVSADSAPISVTPSNTAPAAPTGLQAIASEGQVELQWTPPPGMTPQYSPPQYTVYRSTKPGGPYQAVIQTSVANALDVGLTNGTPYTFVVRAANAAGQGAASSPVTATPSAQGAVSIDAGGVQAGSFVADRDWSGGQVVHLAAPVNTTTTDLSVPQAVWQSARAGTFTYTVRGLVPNALYNLRLLFATSAGSPNEPFEVTVNGVPALIDLTVPSETGGGGEALVENIDTSADQTGALTLHFAPMPGTQGSAEVNGIQLYGAP